MKLLSLNVALFESNNSKLSKFLSEQKPDIACFQEVTRAIEKSVIKKYISKDTIDNATAKLEYSLFGPVSAFRSYEENGPGDQVVFSFDLGGLVEFGNYTRSKYKLIKGQNIFLENNFMFVPIWGWPGEKSHAVLVTDLDLGKNKLRVINYHGIWTRDKRGNALAFEACKKINELALENKGETIICGDFNLFPDTPSIKIFESNFKSLVDRYNINTTRPSSNELSGLDRNVVDYILVSKNLKVNRFKVLENEVSDHLPLVLDFEFSK